MSNLTDFFPSGGGGGLTPKFQEFNSSGTFTPTQALIDAGGYIEVFLVGGGGAGNSAGFNTGGQGGEAFIKKMYLTSSNDITVTIGGGGVKTSNSTAPNGGNSTFNGAVSGGNDITALGGKGGGSTEPWTQISHLSPSWPNKSNVAASAGQGFFGYGSGGAQVSTTSGYVGSNLEYPNSGHGGMTGNDSSKSSNGSSGYCLIKWYE
jgi:hypothetical protein